MAKYLTQKQIKAAAKAGLVEALECSRIHWRQLEAAGPGDFWHEMRKTVVETRISYGYRHCALCHRYGDLKNDVFPDCSRCVLVDRKACCPEYWTAVDAIDFEEAHVEWSPKALIAIRGMIARLTKEIRKAKRRKK